MYTSSMVSVGWVGCGWKWMWSAIRVPRCTAAAGSASPADLRACARDDSMKSKFCGGPTATKLQAQHCTAHTTQPEPHCLRAHVLSGWLGGRHGRGPGTAGWRHWVHAACAQRSIRGQRPRHHPRQVLTGTRCTNRRTGLVSGARAQGVCESQDHVYRTAVRERVLDGRPS